ncbi:hypothetical protein GcC1_184049 [Golovinomyces cichoracearum]|uniref:Uncharacterized protein n=1 Tax=Golovinomyces cichoracearum TaxID=62708 RepID=A0A420HLA8_9PEZI|nr:hypothetical protein GcC1_184049 [Golovinomyces cichoracearum]
MELRSKRTVGTCQKLSPELEFNHWDQNVKMDFESFITTQKSSTVITLERWQDWPLWFDQLKIWCVRNEIWDDVNPEVYDEQPNLIRPLAPIFPLELNSETRANYQIENAVYTNELRLWKEKDIAFKQLDEYLKSSVGSQYKQHLMGKASERAKLKSLFNQVKPTVASIKADLKAEYELLKLTPFGKSVNGYFSRWHILNIKCQTSTQSIFVTCEEDPSLSLHEGLQQIDPIIATFRINKINDDINKKSCKKVSGSTQSVNLIEENNIGAAILAGSAS